MEELVSLMFNVARIVIIVAGSGAAIAVAVAGMLYIFAAGDPQKQRVARDAFIGAVVGMLVCGAAFIVPRVVSNFVLEPSGGEGLTTQGTVSCDETLRNRLVIERQASTADRMNQVIAVIQAKQKDCARDIWAPVAVDMTAVAGVAKTCTDPAKKGTLGGFDVPSTLQQVVTASTDATDFARIKSGRDTDGNIIVHFTVDGAIPNPGAPADNAICWMYLIRAQTWFSEF